MEKLVILILTISGFLLLTNLSHKLRILQEKDYWRGRVFADKSTWYVKFTEIYLACILFEEIIIYGALSNSSYQLIRLIQILLLGVAAVYEIYLLKKRLFKRPRPTLRIALIAGFIITFILIAVIIYPYRVLLILVFNIATMLLVLTGNEMARHIVYIGHRKQLRKAGDNLNSIDNLIRIGITGSYGKSSTKGFLNTILQESHQIVSTPGSINTDIGLALSINKQLGKLSKHEKNKIDFAVLEMDAYVIGTIARVTKYFPLDIALVTSINEQHLDTFGGDIQNTIKGNFQIFTGLKPEGKKIGVVNYDNKYCRQMAEEFREQNLGEMFFYGQDKYESKGKLSAVYSNVKTTHKLNSGYVSFDLRFSKDLGGGNLKIELPLLGEFHAQNYTAAALLARLAGASDKDIVNAAGKVGLKQKTLDLHVTKSGIEIIDDTFNANPESVKANLEILSQRNDSISAPTLVIFTGLHDIGPQSENIHQRLGKLLTDKTDLTIVTNKTFGNEIVSILSGEESKKILIETNPEEVIKQIKLFINNLSKNRKPAARIMMINNIPASVYKFIKNLD